MGFSFVGCFAPGFASEGRALFVLGIIKMDCENDGSLRANHLAVGPGYFERGPLLGTTNRH